MMRRYDKCLKRNVNYGNTKSKAYNSLYNKSFCCITCYFFFIEQRNFLSGYPMYFHEIRNLIPYMNKFSS